MSKCPLRQRRLDSQGSVNERPNSTDASKELQARLAAMNAERATQDTMWLDQQPQQTQKPTNTCESHTNLSPSSSGRYQYVPSSQQRVG